MSANQIAPLEELLVEIDREPPRRRAFWKALAEHLRRRHARLPMPKPPSRRAGDGIRPDGGRAPAASAKRRFRPLRLLFLIVGILGAPFQAAPSRLPR
jgi:hypothetical protein